MKKFLIVLCLNMLVISLSADDYAVVERSRAIMRKGPASYHKVIFELAKNTKMKILSEDDGWLRVEVKDSLGYVSKKVIVPEKAQEDVFSRMAIQPASLDVSKHGISAGVKGFADKFISKFHGDKEFLDRLTNFRMDQDKFRKFRKETYKGFNLTKNQQKIILPQNDVKDFFSFMEEGIGIGIASRIAALGIYDNPKVEEYINFVGNIVLTSSDIYDQNIKFFILDTDLINAYACPGGIIFITKGLLSHLRTEAELAYVLGHEITHISRHHGMKEIGERKQQIQADLVFAELDNELEEAGYSKDTEVTQIEEEMEDLSLEIFETIFQGRLENYEFEADQLGLLYAARSGYDSRNAINLLKRLSVIEPQSTNEHYKSSCIVKRLEEIQKNPDKITLPDNLFKHTRRWREIKIYLN